MRVAVVHSFYRSGSPSGENLIVQEQIKALRDAGHEVTLVSQASDDQTWSLGRRLSAGVRVMRWDGFDPMPSLKAARPDVVHVHNLFPNFGYGWLAEWPGPVVATLHNFRSVCANGLLFRGGKVCMDCPEGQPWAGAIHGCYHESRAATLPLAMRNRFGVAGDPLLSRADVVVLLSESAASLMEGFGLARSHCLVVPNGVEVPASSPNNGPNHPWGAVFIGRLSSEKGILELLRDWPDDVSLDVIGSGPLEKQARDCAGPQVRFLGRLEREEVMALLPEYGALVMPSRCFEMQATSVVEALGSGVPVVAWEGTSGAALVRDEACGAVYGERPSLRLALDEVRAGGDTLRQRARATYEAHFTEQAWITGIEGAYRKAAEQRSVHGP